MTSGYRVLVFSDSHGSTKEMIRVVNSYDKVDMILHAGDAAADLLRIKNRIKHKAELIAVNGNVDPGSMKEAVFDIQGYKVLLIHGKTLGVKNTMNKIDYYARQKGCDIAIFGHSHLPYLNNLGDLYLLNPGSIAVPKGAGKTYAVIAFDENKKIGIEIYNYIQ